MNIYSFVQSRVTIFCACHSLCQVQRSVAPRCGCELNAQCVMCSGRALPPADTQHQLPLLDRLAQFDPCVHPILSFTDGEDTPLSFNCLFLSFFPVCTHVCRPKQWRHQGPVFLTFLVLLRLAHSRGRTAFKVFSNVDEWTWTSSIHAQYHLVDSFVSAFTLHLRCCMLTIHAVTKLAVSLCGRPWTLLMTTVVSHGPSRYTGGWSILWSSHMTSTALSIPAVHFPQTASRMRSFNKDFFSLLHN